MAKRKTVRIIKGQDGYFGGVTIYGEVGGIDLRIGSSYARNKNFKSSKELRDAIRQVAEKHGIKI
jgi:hypothetical protein